MRSCTCLIRHPSSMEERGVIAKRLHEARRKGNVAAEMLFMAQLATPCLSRMPKRAKMLHVLSEMKQAAERELQTTEKV